MKTYHQVILFAATLGFTALASAGFADPSPPAATADATGLWTDIKNDTYDLREHFFSGVKLLQARVDAQISELNAKRAAMDRDKGTDIKAWDFAMKEMGNAHSYLLSMGEEATKAPRDSWDQQREKVGQAWLRTQDAYDKVKASTTS